MDNTCLYWLIAVIVLTLVELATYQLVSIWLAGGALVGMIACVLGARGEIQLIAAIVAAAVLLAGTRPFVKKMLDSKKQPTNVDSLIGKTAVVVTKIDNTAGKGQVKVDGSYWTARSSDNEPIYEGDVAVIEKIEGVKLIVRKK